MTFSGFGERLSLLMPLPPSVLIFLLGLICLLAGLVYANVRLVSERRRRRHLEADLQKLQQSMNNREIEQLRYKINPHLFKNILNSIQSHAYQTYFSLDKLSSVLDYILYESDRRLVSLREEVAFAENLIVINRLKLSPLFDIRVKNRIADSHPLYDQDLVAPMIFVDLIENAFKHADLQSQDAFIAVTFELKDEFFTLSVANKISATPALRKTKSGLGRQTLEKRLELIYKDCYELRQFEENGVFISHLKLDLLGYKAKVLAAG